ncbi:hypothetical protein B0H63DRAFT_513558 [Podospora didyma]|uniref:Uncharacterized protein n=1 Tax=Podospora didyma TaxID=330526 RepID=A0AAE0K9K3_9PEZI|nr:hypothetical protein B0H63DRAFT_513558 [Podospora didyma]
MAAIYSSSSFYDGYYMFPKYMARTKTVPRPATQPGPRQGFVPTVAQPLVTFEKIPVRPLNIQPGLLTLLHALGSNMSATISSPSGSENREQVREHQLARQSGHARSRSEVRRQEMQYRRDMVAKVMDMAKRNKQMKVAVPRSPRLAPVGGPGPVPAFLLKGEGDEEEEMEEEPEEGDEEGEEDEEEQVGGGGGGRGDYLTRGKPILPRASTSGQEYFLA